MADQKRWFKVWTTIINDPSFLSLEVSELGRWTILGAWIAMHGNNGKITTSLIALSLVLRCELNSVLGMIKNLPGIVFEKTQNDNGTIVVIMENWAKYQKDSTSYERLKRWRDNGDKTKTKKRKEKKIKESGDNGFKLPEWVDNKAWNNFIEMRNKIRKPMTEKAKSLIVIELTKLRDKGNNPIEVLNQSIVNSWQGVFELKREKQFNSTTSYNGRKIQPL